MTIKTTGKQVIHNLIPAFTFFMLLHATASLVGFINNAHSAQETFDTNHSLEISQKVFLKESQAKKDKTFDLSRSVFPVVLSFLPRTRRMGTIFYIGNNRFVTSLHVLYAEDSENIIPSEDYFYFEFSSKNQSISLYYSNQYIPFQKVIATNKRDDLAVLELNSTKFKKIQSELIPLELNPDKDTSFVSLYGFNFSNWHKKNPNIKIQNYKRTNIFDSLLEKIIYKNVTKDSVIWYHNNQILDGMSGSPLLNDGQVVGILCCSDKKVFVGTHVSRLISLLENRHIEDHYP